MLSPSCSEHSIFLFLRSPSKAHCSGWRNLSQAAPCGCATPAFTSRNRHSVTRRPRRTEGEAGHPEATCAFTTTSVWKGADIKAGWEVGGTLTRTQKVRMFTRGFTSSLEVRYLRWPRGSKHNQVLNKHNRKINPSHVTHVLCICIQFSRWREERITINQSDEHLSVLRCVFLCVDHRLWIKMDDATLLPPNNPEMKPNMNPDTNDAILCLGANFTASKNELRPKQSEKFALEKNLKFLCDKNYVKWQKPSSSRMYLLCTL